MPPKTQLNEKTWFKRDNETTDDAKNAQLAALLGDIWSDLSIVEVKRIEIGDSGWLLTYRE